MPGIYGGYDFKMAYMNNAGSRLAQKGGKTYLIPMKMVSVPNAVIPEVMEMATPSNLGDPRQVQVMNLATKGG